MATAIQLDDWDEVLAELDRFATSGDVTTEEGWIRVDLGSAHVEMSRDGRVSTGMPLHEFEHDGDVEIVVDHEAGSLTIESENLSYTFRRPGG